MTTTGEPMATDLDRARQTAIAHGWQLDEAPYGLADLEMVCTRGRRTLRLRFGSRRGWQLWSAGFATREWLDRPEQLLDRALDALRRP